MGAKDRRTAATAWVRSGWPVAAVVALLLVVLLGAVSGSVAGRGSYRALPVPTPSAQGQCPAGVPAASCPRGKAAQPGATGAARTERHSLWFTIPFLLLVYGVFVLAALVLLGWAVAAVTGVLGGAGQVRIRRRERARDDHDSSDDALGGPRPAADSVEAAVAAGLADLDENDDDPRRAVIAAWSRLERAAAEAGTSRLPSDTPTELVVRLLTAHAVSPTALEELAALYREARFSAHPLDERTRAAARRALGRIRAELTAAVPA